MTNLLMFAFIFFVGSILGWIIELFFRRIVHKKWVNPGFLIGPYLPIYGFGLCSMTLIYMIVNSFNLNFFCSDIIAILLMGVIMTLLELIGGFSFIYGGGVKLWDYSNRWGNYKGIICPLFSLIWTLVGGLYYYFLAGPVISLITWFTNHLSFSFVVGYFFGIITIDFVYSTNLLMKVKKFAKDNDLVVKYEELKLELKKQTEKNKEKYSFIFPFKNKLYLIDNLKKINIKNIMVKK